MTKKSKKKKDLELQREIVKSLPEDFIGRASFVSYINNLIKIANEEKFWTFAIDGEWGTGKSYVLSMLELELCKDEKLFVVKYDAWKNDFYKDPLIAIIYNILDEIEKKKDSFFNEVAKGIRAGLLMFYDIIKEVPGVKQIDKQVKNIKKRIDQQQQQHIPEITQEFLSYNDAIKKLRIALTKLTKKCKLVILVDELDRCDYEYALTALNRLHNVFEIPNSVSVVAVNKKQLSKMIDNKYGLVSGEKYLEKFFDLTLELPASGEIDIRQKYAERLLMEYMQEENLDLGRFFVRIILSTLKKNAREVVKFFEKLRLLLKDFEDKNFKYDMLCITAFLLASHFKFNEFLQADFANTNHPIDIVDEFAPNISSYVSSSLLNYIGKQRSGTGYGNEPQRYSDLEIVRFFAMLNIVKYHNNPRVMQRAISHFGIDFDSKYRNEIIEVVNKIILLEQMQ